MITFFCYVSAVALYMVIFGDRLKRRLRDRRARARIDRAKDDIEFDSDQVA